MSLPIRRKLVLLSVLVMVVVSFGFTALNLALSSAWVEDDLKERAIAFAREVAVTLGHQRELEGNAELEEQIREILAVRRTVAQLDVLTFDGDGGRVVATSHPGARLPFTRQDTIQARRGRVVSRLVDRAPDRHWEVLAPVTLDGTIVGAVAARFSLVAADRLAVRARAWAFTLTAASVVVMGLLMTLAVRRIVDRPIQRFMEAIAAGPAAVPPAPVLVETADEFGLLATHFNAMVDRITRFSTELQERVREATEEAEQRLGEVERLNAVLFDLQRSLTHAERLAVSGRIVAEVAHEIGTPLHSIAGHLELLQKELTSDRPARDAARRLGIVQTQLGRVTEIIARMLDVTRRPGGELGVVDLNGLVSETAELIRPAVAAGGRVLDVATETGLPGVLGDRIQLQQVLVNLLTNAIDAAPAGGRVGVATRAARDVGQVVVEVSDDGPGIPAAHRERIFEAFFSTKEPARGTGLGLFIAAQILRDHKGRIEVDSAPGRGSTFRVILPALGGAA